MTHNLVLTSVEVCHCDCWMWSVAL